MIGGIVTETIVLPDKVWVDCVESQERCNDKCAIYVERNENSLKIKPGDSFWWQSGSAMWTPFENKGKAGNKSHIDYDIRIPRIGFSGVSRPTSAVKEKGQEEL